MRSTNATLGIPVGIAGTKITAKLRSSELYSRIAQSNPFDIPAKRLRPVILGVLETRGVVGQAMCFFRHGGELIEVGEGRGIEHLRIADTLTALGLKQLSAPKFDLHSAKKLTESIWGDRAQQVVYVLTSAAPFGREIAAQREAVWLCMALSQKRAQLALISATTGQMLFMLPARVNGIAFRGIGLLLKIAALVVLILIAKSLGWTGWGAVVAVLGILVVLLTIVLELLAIAKKNWPPRPPPIPPPPGTGVNPFEEYIKRLEAAKKKAEDLKKKLDERAKRHDKFDPLDPDYDQVRKIFDDLNKTIEDGEKSGALTPEQKNELEGYEHDAEKLLPK